MCKIVFSILILFSLVAEGQKKKVLIVSTNRDSVGVHASGSYLPEIAYPFQYFIDKGFEVNILTPKGGKAAIYSRGELSEKLNTIWKSESFHKSISSTISPEQINVNEYSAVYYPGGHGQYFDVVNDERIALLVKSIYENGGVIGTAGHGAASLINIQLTNGKYFVEGKTMTCFPHWAELKWMNISGYGKLLAFDMQEILARRGANLILSTFETRSDPELTLVVDKENKIVTGSFAQSAEWVAEQMYFLLQQEN